MLPMPNTSTTEKRASQQLEIASDSLCEPNSRLADPPEFERPAIRFDFRIPNDSCAEFSTSYEWHVDKRHHHSDIRIIFLPYRPVNSSIRGTYTHAMLFRNRKCFEMVVGLKRLVKLNLKSSLTSLSQSSNALSQAINSTTPAFAPVPQIAQPKKKSSRILELDALRAISCLNLLLFHFTYVYQNKYGFESPLGKQIDQSTVVFVRELKESW